MAFSRTPALGSLLDRLKEGLPHLGRLPCGRSMSSESRRSPGSEASCAASSTSRWIGSLPEVPRQHSLPRLVQHNPHSAGGSRAAGSAPGWPRGARSAGAGCEEGAISRAAKKPTATRASAPAGPQKSGRHRLARPVPQTAEPAAPRPSSRQSTRPEQSGIRRASRRAAPSRPDPARRAAPSPAPAPRGRARTASRCPWTASSSSKVSSP